MLLVNRQSTHYFTKREKLYIPRRKRISWLYEDCWLHGIILRSKHVGHARSSNSSIFWSPFTYEYPYVYRGGLEHKLLPAQCKTDAAWALNQQRIWRLGWNDRIASSNDEQETGAFVSIACRHLSGAPVPSLENRCSSPSMIPTLNFFLNFVAISS